MNMYFGKLMWYIKLPSNAHQISAPMAKICFPETGARVRAQNSPSDGCS